MKRLVRLVAYGLLVLVVFAIGVLGIAWWRTEVALDRVYTLTEVKLDVSGDPAQVERGRQLAVTRAAPNRVARPLRLPAVPASVAARLIRPRQRVQTRSIRIRRCDARPRYWP
jgi:hypothetical protein